MMRMNRLFIGLLKSLRSGSRLPLSDQLNTIASGMVVIDGCYLLSREAKKNINARVSDFSDKTGYECFVNHVHIDDYVPNDLANQSISYASYRFQITLNARRHRRHYPNTARQGRIRFRPIWDRYQWF
jgi:hypothetical protein